MVPCPLILVGSMVLKCARLFHLSPSTRRSTTTLVAVEEAESQGENLVLADLDPVILARAQFAFTVSFHFIFPAFSIGTASYLMVLEGLWLKTGAAFTPTSTAIGSRSSP